MPEALANIYAKKIKKMKKIYFSLIALLLIGNKAISQEWTKLNPKEVGSLHNQYLIDVLNVYYKDPQISNKNALLEINSTMTKEEKLEILNNSEKRDYKTNVRLIMEHLKSPESIKRYNDVTSVLNNSSKYTTLDRDLTILSSQIEKELTGKEEKIVLLYLEGIRSSAQIWFSKEDGGTGLGVEFLKNKEGSYTIAGRNKYVTADGAGVGAGFTCWAWGVALFGGPVTVVGMLGAVALSAAYSSMTA